MSTNSSLNTSLSPSQSNVTTSLQSVTPIQMPPMPSLHYNPNANHNQNQDQYTPPPCSSLGYMRNTQYQPQQPQQQSYQYHPQQHSYQYSSPQIFQQRKQQTNTQNMASDETKFCLTFKRDKKPNSAYYKLYSALSETPGIKGFKTLRLNITKFGDVDSESDDDTNTISIIPPSDKKTTKTPQSSKTPQSPQNNKTTKTLSDNDIKKTLKWVYMNESTDRTKIKNQIGVKDDISLQIFSMLAESNLLFRPGVKKYFIKRELFVDNIDKIECGIKLYSAKMKTDFEIQDDRIKKIYDEVVKEMNTEKAEHLKKLDILLQKKKTEKLKRRRDTEKCDTTAQPATKRQKLNEDDSKDIENDS